MIQQNIYGGFLTWGYPQIIHFNGIFHYKPTILDNPHYGTPHLLLQNIVSASQEEMEVVDQYVSGTGGGEHHGSL